jgi:hypothetical protein
MEKDHRRPLLAADEIRFKRRFSVFKTLANGPEKIFWL